MVKIYGSYGGLFVFKLFDDYRVCVKKRNFYGPPSAATSATRGGVSRLRVGDIIFTSRDGGGGRIGGDVVLYVEYAIAAVYEDAEKKIRRTCYRLLGIPHTFHNFSSMILNDISTISFLYGFNSKSTVFFLPLYQRLIHHFVQQLIHPQFLSSVVSTIYPSFFPQWFQQPIQYLFPPWYQQPIHRLFPPMTSTTNPPFVSSMVSTAYPSTLGS